MGTVIVGIALLCVVTLIVKNIIKDKRNGKSVQCGGECKHCGGGCH